MLPSKGIWEAATARQAERSPKYPLAAVFPRDITDREVGTLTTPNRRRVGKKLPVPHSTSRTDSTRDVHVAFSEPEEASEGTIAPIPPTNPTDNTGDSGSNVPAAEKKSANPISYVSVPSPMDNTKDNDIVSRDRNMKMSHAESSMSPTDNTRDTRIIWTLSKIVSDKTTFTSPNMSPTDNTRDLGRETFSNYQIHGPCQLDVILVPPSLMDNSKGGRKYDKTKRSPPSLMKAHPK